MQEAREAGHIWRDSIQIIQTQYFSQAYITVLWATAQQGSCLGLGLLGLVWM